MNEKGLTFIELSIVVIIIGIITASEAVSFSKLGGTKLDADSRKIITDISWARERAAATHMHQGFSFDTVNRAYSVYKSPTATPADFVGNNLLKRVRLEVSLSLVPVNLWIYSPRGNASGPAVITLDYGGKARQVRIFPDTGYARIE